MTGCVRYDGNTTVIVVEYKYSDRYQLCIYSGTGCVQARRPAMSVSLGTSKDPSPLPFSSSGPGFQMNSLGT